MNCFSKNNVLLRGGTVKKVSVIGLFCQGQKIADGQSVKTRIVAEELEKSLGEENVWKIDTYNWKKNPIKLFFN